MIKTVLFDLGNVILPFDLTRLANQLALYSPFSPKEILEKIAYTEVFEVFETGRMSPEDYYEFVVKACQFSNLPFEGFVAIFNDIFREDHEVWDLISSLKKKYKLGLISNTNPIHSKHLRTNVAKLEHFEQLWFSDEAGVRKPDQKIYKMALGHFESQPSETIFIDDFEINVKSAAELGIKALHYKGFEKLKKDLQALGVQY